MFTKANGTRKVTQGRMTLKAEVTNKNTEETQVVKLVEEDLPSDGGKGPYGMVGVGLRAGFSLGFQSLSIDLSAEMPVSRCTSLTRAAAAQDAVVKYLKHRLAKEVPEILDTLETFVDTVDERKQRKGIRR